MRPLSFTRNIGGLQKVYEAIRKGYVPGVTVNDFRKRCGLGPDLSLLVTEFFLCTQVRNGQEYILGDTLITQTLTRTSYERTLARLYFFALNLNMPGERLKPEHREAGVIQHFLVTERIYSDTGWVNDHFDKDAHLEPAIREIGDFESNVARRKWVNNYWFIMDQCAFLIRTDGMVETFADNWGLLALRLFFERYTALHPTDDADALVRAAYDSELHKLIGVPRSWLENKLEGAADMFLAEEFYAFEGFEESSEERKALQKGQPIPSPSPGSPAQRRQVKMSQLIRRGDNRRFVQSLYGGICQVSGVILRLPGGGFTVDCAHIRPLGTPHNGPDDVSNMLSLSPTMHRLFDRGCILIDPSKLSIKLLHGNDIPHLPKLLLKPEHTLSKEHLAYYNASFVK